MVSRFTPVFTAVFFTALSCLFGSETVLAVIPDSHNPDAYTENQYRLDLLEYNTRTMSGAYLQVGQRDPKWDDLAVELLDVQAQRFTNYRAQKYDAVPESIDADRRHKIIDKLEEMGCDDPLVMYMTLRHLSKDDPGFLELARKTHDGLYASSYPVIRRLAMASWLYRLLETADEQAQRDHVADQIEALCLEALTGKPMPAKDQRHIRKLMADTLEALPRGRWESVVQQAEASDSPNRWLIDMVGGEYHYRMAWDARGSGFARTVTDEGWEGFETHLEQANERLTRAWEAHPDFPSVPARMISVSMGLGDSQERLWFERTVHAQFDYYPAYTRYLWSIRPRWHGSLNQMYAFGVECLKTDRFDTRVPGVFYKVMGDLYDETDDYSYWHRPGVHENFITYYEGRKREPGGEDDQAWWDSMKAVIAWRLGEYDLAAQQIEELGDAFNPEAFSRLGGEPLLAASEVYVRSNPTTDATARSVDKLWDQRRYRRAAEMLDVSLPEISPGDPARPFLENKAAQSRWRHKRQQGVWVDLLGRSDMGGWDVERGEWEMDGQGGIIGHSLDNGLAAVCRVKFGYRYELKGNLECLRAPDPEEINGGILMVYQVNGSYAYHRDVLLYPKNQSVLAARTFRYATESFPAELAEKNTFHLQVWDRHVRLTVNGQVVIAHRKMPRKLPGTKYRFALGGYYDQPGASIRFDGLKVRRLNQRPGWMFQKVEHGVKAGTASP